MQDVASTVYAGVDTHKDKHVLCLLDGLGRRTFVGEFPADADGYDALAYAIGDPGTRPVVGVEGTTSFGAGLTDELRRLGFDVLEVPRPKRDRRRRGPTRTTPSMPSSQHGTRRPETGRRCPSRGTGGSKP